MSIRCDVVNLGGVEKFQITGDVGDPLMVRTVEFAKDRLNIAGRGPESDEVKKSLERHPMGSAADGTNLPGDMEPEGHQN